jgi:hypothetical protein
MTITNTMTMETTMSETKEPYKWYWAYTSPSIDGTTYVFNTEDEALDHAISNGEFDEVFKDNWPDKQNELLFELGEDELPDYLPIQFINNMKEAA